MESEEGQERYIILHSAGGCMAGLALAQGMPVFSSFQPQPSVETEKERAEPLNTLESRREPPREQVPAVWLEMDQVCK